MCNQRQQKWFYLSSCIAVLIVSFYHNTANASSLIEDKLSTQQDTGNSSNISASGGNVAFEASQEQKTIKARYVKSINDFTIDFLLEAPFDTDNEQIITADLDGLNDNTSFSGKMTYFWGEPAWAEEQQKKNHAIFKQAAERLGEEYPKIGIDYDETYLEKLKNIDIPLYEQLSSKFDRLTDEVLGFNLPFIGAVGKIGQKKYQYTDPLTAESNEASETNYSLSGYAGFLTKSDYLLLAGYRFEKYYKGGKEVDFCYPYDGGNNLLCKNTSLTPIKQIETNIIYGEVRKYFGNFGVNPKISYDMDNDITGVECGFYFIPDTNGLLVGGVKVGWNSEDDDFVASLVLGVPFRFFD